MSMMLEMIVANDMVRCTDALRRCRQSVIFPAANTETGYVIFGDIYQNRAGDANALYR